MHDYSLSFFYGDMVSSSLALEVLKGVPEGCVVRRASVNAYSNG